MNLSETKKNVNSLITVVVALPARIVLAISNWLAVHAVYSPRVYGRKNIPIKGGALLVANHVSWVDALILSVSCGRKVRFIMERSIYNNRLMRPIFKLAGVIPISARDSRQVLVASLRQARQALDDGQLVCIFAEGAITRNGNIGPFKSGLESIVKGGDHKIVPIYMAGLWGSIFSYAQGKLLPGLPKKIRRPVRIYVGENLSADKCAAEVRQAVVELSSIAHKNDLSIQETLGHRFITTARANWDKKAINDTTGQKLTYGKTLTAAVALGAQIEKHAAGQEMVGVILPPSVAGVMINLAITLRGKVPVNLNFTAGEEAMKSAVAQCGIENIITSREVIEKLGKVDLGKLLFIEDLIANIGKGDKVKAYLSARMIPAKLLAGDNDIATVIFSSGSTGEPKGVVLTHKNILANIEGMQTAMSISGQDNICAALPFFHSLGFTGTLWLPLLSGFSASYHPNPLDGGAIAKVVRKNKSSLLLATPTFLTAYMRKAHKEDFDSLRMVMTGAEKLQERVASAFEEKYGIRPMEGYGATELAPVACVSVPEVNIAGVRQVGAKAGSVGRPLPGVAVRIVDQSTGATVPAGESGLILVRGGNVMREYLGNEVKTAEVLKDEWYSTGDIGYLDNDGFLFITDRASRFSKIGGEMVPHIAIEEAIASGLQTSEQVVAVCAVPDEKKGEKLVVLYVEEEVNPEEAQAAVEAANMPNLWKPAKNSYYPIEKLPVLGTGKLDLKTLKNLALAAATN